MKKYELEITGKGAWITDLHLVDQKKSFYLNRFFPFVLDNAVKNGCSFIINTGDTFDNHNELLGTELDIYRTFLSEAKKRNIIVITAVGNHDLCGPVKETQTDSKFNYIHSIEGFNDIEGHFVVDKPTIFKINGLEVGVTPFCRTEEHYKEMLNTFSGVDSVFGHFDCDGFKYSPETGEVVDKWCTPAHFNGFKNVYSGHYHTRQNKCINGNTEMVYLGTQYTTNHGQTNQDKYMGIVDIGTGIEFIKTPFTLHKTYEIKVGDDVPKKTEEDKLNGVNVRLAATGTVDQFKSFKIPKEFAGNFQKRVVDEKIKRLELSATANRRDTVVAYIDHTMKKRFPDMDKASLKRDRLIAMSCRYLGVSNSGPKEEK